jgi:signal transduction histidine kinase
MTQPASKRGEFLDFWQHRERRAMLAGPYVLLGLCLIIDLATRGGSATGAIVDVAAALATTLLMGVLDRHDDRTSWIGATPFPVGVGVAAMAGLVGLSIVLNVDNSVFGFYSWTGYIWAYRLLPGRLRFAGVALNAVAVAIAQTGSGRYTNAGEIATVAAVWLVNAILANLFLWFGWLSNQQEERRAQEVSQLTLTNTALAESLRENAELHQQLVGQARDAGIADERRRLAAEIHDGIAQGLMGIITQLQAAQRDGIGAAEADRRVGSAIELARLSLSGARRSVAALAPQQLVGARLPDAVRSVAEQWGQRNDIQVAFSTTGELRPTPPEVELALLRTAQEALANVAKHARAGRVGLTLSYMDDRVTLDVRDDGIGFDPAACPASPVDGEWGGYGLNLMRERIEGVAGTLEVESEPDSGTAISAAVPLVAP